MRSLLLLLSLFSAGYLVPGHPVHVEVTAGACIDAAPGDVTVERDDGLVVAVTAPDVSPSPRVSGRLRGRTLRLWIARDDDGAPRCTRRVTMRPRMHDARPERVIVEDRDGELGRGVLSY